MPIEHHRAFQIGRTVPEENAHLNLKRSPEPDSFQFAAALSALGIFFAIVSTGYIRRYSISAAAVAGIYLCFLLSLGIALASGFSGMRCRLEGLLASPRRALWLPVLWCVPYLMYAAGTGDFKWIALSKLAAIAAVLLGVYCAFPVRRVAPFAIQDALVAVVLILVVLSGWLTGVWNIPLKLDFMGRLFLLGVASGCWVFVRRVPSLGYEFRFSRRVVAQATRNFLYFAAIAIPAGFVLRFTAWNPRWHGLFDFVANFLEIFLFIALLEELFFRGFLQTLLSNSLGSWAAAQALVSLVFGFFHILHRPFPNWRYVALATLAGWFYGSAFRKGGNLMAPALMHAAVDTVWRTWFTAG